MVFQGILKQTTAVTVTILMIDSSDHITGKTGLAAGLTVYQSKAGAATGAITPTSVTEIDSTNAKGLYALALNTTSWTNTLGEMMLHITATGADPADFKWWISTRLPDDLAFPATTGRSMVVDAAGLVDANAVKLGPTGSGTAQTARDIGASVLLSAGSGAGQLDFTSGVVKGNLAQILGTALTETAGQLAGGFKKFFNIGAPASTMDHLTLIDTVTTATTATNLTNAPTAGDFTATMKTSIGTAVAASAVASVTAGVTLAAGAITDAATAADSGRKSIRTNTAQAGGATTITLDAGASATNSFYNNTLILTTSGTGAGQARFITAYVGATKVATVAAWVTNPDNTTTFSILPFDAVAGASAPTVAQIATGIWQDLLSSSDFSTASSIGKLLKDDIDAAVSSRMATFSLPTNFSSLSIDGSGRVDVAKVGGTSQTAGDIIATINALNNLSQANVRTAVGLASANLDTQLGNIRTDTNTTLPALIAALNNLSSAQVKTQVVNALSSDTYGEPAQGTPGATVDLATKIGMVYKALINKLDQTGSLFELYNNAGTIVDHKATVTDDGTTFTRAKIVSGP